MRQLDLVLHSPTRIAIVSRLLVVGPMRFAALRDAVGLTGGTLASHLDVLERAGYVAQRTGLVALRPAKVVVVTARGREAFFAYVAMLDQLVGELKRIKD